MAKRKIIQFARMEKGYTQLDLAKLIGVKEHEITLIETGRKEPSPAVAQRIAKTLDTKKEKLFPDLFLNEEVKK